LVKLTNDGRSDAVKVNILEAKTHLSKLVKAAAAGREIVIASNGTPMAKLVPIHRGRRLRSWGSLKVGRARIDAAFTAEIDAAVARALRGKV
jgi:prevent-host-death family protein